jgi:ABC-2 type transport system ATP-binding protein
MGSTEPALRLRGVTKNFGATRAVDSLDLVVPRGATYGVIGPSGAGKTTCIRMIMSILFPDSGELSVLGRRSALEAKSRIGYLPEERGVYRKMRVGDFLSYIAQLKEVSEGDAAARSTRLLARLGLDAVEKKRCEDLSKGMLQRVQFVAAVINEPELLILDEPFSGLDPVSVRMMKEVIADEQRRGAAILFSTHVMPHAEELCQHVVMIHKGQKVLDEPMAGLRRQYDRSLIRFEPLDADVDLSPLRVLPGVLEMRPMDGGCELQLAPGSDPAVVMRQIAAAVAPARLELARVRLEDVFIRLVGESAPGADAERALRANLQGLGTEAALV